MRSIQSLLCFIILFGLQIAYAGHSFDKPSRANELSEPMALDLIPLKSKHYAIEVMIGDKGPYKFMIDTGASVSVISQRLASKLKLENTKQVKYTRNEKKYNANLYRIPKITMGNAEIYDYDLLAYPEPSFISYMKKNFGEDIDGILGVGAFYHYLLTIDIPQNALILNTGKLSADSDTKKYQNQEKLPIVPVVFKDNKNSRRLNFVIDTGSNESFTMPPTVKTLPFKKLSSTEFHTGSHYGEQTATKVKVKADAFWGEKEFNDPTVIYNEKLYDSSVNFGLLGLKVMKQFKITIDQQNTMIKVE